MSHGTVLVVDDEVDLANLFTTLLQKEYTVLTAHDGLEAMDLLDDTVDVVTLDRRMAGVTGDQLLVWIREEGFDCAVVVVSAVHPDDSPLPVESDAYLNKPVPNEQFVAEVRKFIP